MLFYAARTEYVKGVGREIDKSGKGSVKNVLVLIAKNGN